MPGPGLLERIDRIMAELAELRAVVAEETSAARCELRSALAGLNLTGISEGEIAALAGALDACGGRRAASRLSKKNPRRQAGERGPRQGFQKERGAG